MPEAQGVTRHGRGEAGWPSESLPPQRRLVIGSLRARLSGPGGYYNLGNAIGLAMGIALQISAAGDHAVSAGPVDTILRHFAGSDSAVALTIATLLFLWSGEIYHRAWSRGAVPDARLNRLGDFVSGVGALAFGVALYLLGQPVLAATAGLLHAFGKFGSSLHQPGAPSLSGWPSAWPDPFRSVVLISRVPAMAAAVLELLSAGRGSAGGIAEPATLLICTLLWARADLLLFDSDRGTVTKGETR